MVSKVGSFAVLCAVAAFATPGISQADNFVGVGAGADFSSVTNTGASTSGAKEFAAEAFADWELASGWYLDTGLRYSGYGYSYSGTTSPTSTPPNTPYTYSSAAHYLDIPILIKPTFAVGDWHPYLLAGEELGIKLSESSTYAPTGVASTPYSNIYDAFNFSADVGAGTEIPINPALRAYVQVVYSLGLVNTTNYQYGNSTYTRALSLTVGVMVPL